FIGLRAWYDGAKQAPRMGVPCENRHFVAHLDKLGRRSESCGSAAYYGHTLSRLQMGRTSFHEVFLKGNFYDVLFNFFNRHRRFIDAEHACRLTRRRANPACELREIIG